MYRQNRAFLIELLRGIRWYEFEAQLLGPVQHVYKSPYLFDFVVLETENKKLIVGKLLSGALHAHPNAAVGAELPESNGYSVTFAKAILDLHR